MLAAITQHDWHLIVSVATLLIVLFIAVPRR